MSEIAPCPVCSDRRRIRLPLMRVVSVVQPSSDMMPTIEETSREYDCPECVKKIKTERFEAVKLMSWMDGAMPEEQKVWWRENAVKLMGRMIAEKLLEDGMIEFKKIEPDVYHDEGIQGTIYVALPQHWEPIEERIAERQMVVADEVAAESKRLIDNWGSYFGHAEILKQDARREIDEAVRHVKNARAKK